MNLDVKGGGNLDAYLADLAERIASGGSVRVGFLEGSTYPDGTPVPVVAAANEFGGSFEVAARQQTLYRKVNADGSFAKGGKFVKPSMSNFATDHTIPAHNVTRPARPFFRSMIAAKSPGWGAKFGKVMKAQNYEVAPALAMMGEVIKDELQQSIRDFTTPALARSTIAAKGSAKPLIETGHMLNSVDYEVKET